MPSVISQKFLAQDQVSAPGRGFTLAAKLLTQSWSMDVPAVPGTVGQSLRAVPPAPGSPDKIQLEWYTPSASIFDSSVGANLVLAGPPGNGYPGNPTFRDLEYQDLDQIVGVTSSTIAAGDDPRFHEQNTDVGTTSPTFTLNSLGGANAPVVLKVTATGLELRNAADTDYVNFRVANIVTGNEVNIGDNKILLNADLLPSVTPTEDGGISLSRGNQVAAEQIWNEANQQWEAGVVGAMSAISRYKIFQVTPAEVAAGVVAINHGYGTYVQASYWLPGNTRFTPAEETATAGVLSVDFNGLLFAGVITVRVDG